MERLRAILILSTSALVMTTASREARGGPVEPWANETRPALQAGITAAQASAPTIEGLLARRELNPARFDANQPALGRLLARDLVLRSIRDAGILPAEGLLPLNPRFNYLRWRRSLNEERFDRFHPILGLLLAEDERLRGPLPPTGGGHVNPPPPPPPPPPPHVPEPGSLILLGLGLAGTLGFSRARRQTSFRRRSDS